MARRMKPKGKRGRAAVKRLGRRYKTGGFNKIARKSSRRYGSAKAGKAVAGKVYWNMVRRRKKRSR